MLKKYVQEALSNPGGITTFGEFPEQAYAVLGNLRGLDRRDSSYIFHYKLSSRSENYFTTI